ncbi:DUF4400 domain-containing protein [Pseudoalteromonas sp. ACER1]|uniref:DUF4400 domain-containing protein n=1 Tax=unclassified Pseudoalteromonas TaxID=194690 RepID=UPI001F2E38A8|nr:MULTISPECIES: DUF4400 domain-containing protein [unclassified Pseudoalteromonas]MCF2848838.1 DUF4400 domain-containing protein [Pseudoalteromonas sp. PAST1]MCO7212263.1 DUF4400 domain-containing protein [Pseudoalteromonas sp. ACER1]MCO7251961.1 DUF4400 domain-containing protein [Pseudoalteromonas sp. Ps84H-4]
MIYENDSEDLYKDKSGEQNRKKEYSKLFIFILFALAAQVLALNPTSFNRMLENEVKASYKAIGEKNWLNLTDASYRHYNTIIVRSGFKQYFLDKVNRDTDDKNPLARLTAKLLPLVKRVTNNIQTLTYQILHRANLLMIWLYILVPFALAQLVIGLYSWRIRAYTFGNKTKTRMLVIKKLIKGILVGIIVYFALPNFYPTAGAYIPFIALLFASFLTSRYIATLQKHI